MTRYRNSAEKWILMGIFGLILTILLVAVPAVNARAEEQSGKIGDNISWTIDGSTLTISGEGAIEDLGGAENYPWNDSSVVIKDIYFEDGVTDIPAHCFENNTSIKNVYMVEGIASIGESAFKNCEKLAFLEFSSALTTLGKEAFSGCEIFATASSGVIVFPDGLKVIPEKAFYGCKYIDRVYLPAELEEIEAGAFGLCSTLSAVEFRSSKLKKIGDLAFQGDHRLNSLAFAKKKADFEIAENAFDLTSGQVTRPGKIYAPGPGDIRAYQDAFRKWYSDWKYTTIEELSEDKKSPMVPIVIGVIAALIVIGIIELGTKIKEKRSK